ncbi:hypothetical protein AB1Y20_002329 [Prymnesium parvum]|uniref:tRNA-guanine(15) transglycosylase-like domain-containing protein n=1 Tax=Prymnesium parvum TaxID=97485 RepID=A0AB34J8M5_PRYPA
MRVRAARLLRSGRPRPFASLAPPPLDAGGVATPRWPEWSPRDFFHFELLHQSSRSAARVGRIHTPHGAIDTPGFVPVGTNGALKFVDFDRADAAGMQLMFANSYHLLVHPGADVVARAGGLHTFIGRPHAPLITDSGGFQVFSLAHQGEVLMPGEAPPREAGSRAEAAAAYEPPSSLKGARPLAARLKYAQDGGGAPMVKLSEDGVQLRSYRDGQMLFLSPETSVDAQKALGADIIIPLDELPGPHADGAALERSLRRTHAWEARSLRHHLKAPQRQAMYGVLHGGLDERLRRESAEWLCSLPFDGFAIGGSLGKERAQMLALLRFVTPMLPHERPVHLLGIADELSIPEAVLSGIDTFDSCWPTRLGRHGTLLTRSGRMRIGKAVYRDDYGPIDEGCDGFVSTNYSRAYLHHLWKAREPLVHGLLTLHNIKFMMDLCANTRSKILANEI